MSRPQPQYLIFDLDGTLIDSIPDLTTSLNILRAELQTAPLPPAQVTAMVGDGVTSLVQRALGEKLYRHRHLERFMAIYREHLLDQTRCFPGIEELLSRHDPRHLALVTNKPMVFTQCILDGLKLTDFFTAVSGGDSYAFKKPHPFPVQQALIQLGAAPEQAVMIGDHHTDLHAAHGAGVATCFCAYGFGHAADLVPDYYAQHPRDLLTLFPGGSS